MNYILNAYPQYIQSQVYFKTDAQQWIASLGDVIQQLPLFLAQKLRAECIEAHWVEGTLALKNVMHDSPHYKTLWSSQSPKHESALLASLQADCLPLFDYFLADAEFELAREIFLGVAPEYSPTLKRKNLTHMLEALAEKMMSFEKPMASWLANEKNQDLLEDTLAFSQLHSLWSICEPYASFENKWQRLTQILLSAEEDKKYFHVSNSANKQFLGMWAARPDLNLITPDLKRMVANHLVFSEVDAVVSKNALNKALENVNVSSRTRRL